MTPRPKQIVIDKDALLGQVSTVFAPLTRAAFPEKDVFSSLEEVPESYRCDWAGL